MKPNNLAVGAARDTIWVSHTILILQKSANVSSNKSSEKLSSVSENSDITDEEESESEHRANNLSKIDSGNLPNMKIYKHLGIFPQHSDLTTLANSSKPKKNKSKNRKVVKLSKQQILIKTNLISSTLKQAFSTRKFIDLGGCWIMV